MSLFPAYSASAGDGETSKEDNQKLGTDEDNWLENASFSIKVSEIPLPDIPLPPTPLPKALPLDEILQSDDSIDNSPSTRRTAKSPVIVKETVEKLSKRRHQSSSEEDVRERKTSRLKHSKPKKHHHKSSRKSESVSRLEVKVVPAQNECFFEDKKSERGNLSVPTLSRPAVPFYRVERNYRVLGAFPLTKIYHNWSKKRKSYKKVKHAGRYFRKPLEEILEKEKTSDSIHTVESELTKKTAEFNKILGERPDDIKTWLEYIKFQDTICQFEKTYRKGGGAQGIRVTAERKLAMLDRALCVNYNSEELLQERCRLVEAIFPADEACKQFADMIEKRPGSMALWQGMIGATQFSLSVCTGTKLFELYDKGMTRFHQMRRGAPASQVRPAEENILEFLLQYGLFLRQAGLHEQLWTLIKLYIELNFAIPNVQITSSVSEKTLIETEEVILASNLPLPEIWARVETLRESCHWLPWDSSADCEDPQRVVFTDDVSSMLHPITTPDLSFKLAAVVLTLLKVPFLPCRDTTLQWLRVSHITSHVDSMEILLTTLFPFGVVDSSCAELLLEASQLLAGPTYLTLESHTSLHLGYESYLEFVTKVFVACAESLPEPKRTALYVWWLRFERFLVILVEKHICKPLNKKKKVKAAVKDFLKQEKNRNNLLFYLEYALIERELGNVESACGILKTAISTQHSGEPVIGIGNFEDRSRLCMLYRTLAELLLNNKVVDGKHQALNLLASLGLGLSPPKDLSSHKFTLQERESAAAKFVHISTELLKEVDAGDEAVVDGTEHLLPDFLVDWLTCTAWTLYLTTSTWKAATFLEDCLTKFSCTTSQKTVVTKKRCQREALFESYISLLYYHCQESTGSIMPLQGVVLRALKEFPNNMHFLAVTAKGQGFDGRPWWELKRHLEETNSQVARLFLIFLARDHQRRLEKMQLIEQNCDLTTGPSLTVSADPYKHRTNALFSQLVSHEVTRRCPLVWRLYLKHLFVHGSRDLCRSTFYRAVEEVPWIKALYLDGAKMLPSEMQEIQDLLIEKELRLHVTPEELEILRSNDV